MISKHLKQKIPTKLVILYKVALSLYVMGLNTLSYHWGPPQTSQNTVDMPKIASFSKAPLFVI